MRRAFKPVLVALAIGWIVPTLGSATSGYAQYEKLALGQTASKNSMSLEFLTPTDGVSFEKYLQHMYVSIRQKWIATMPESVALGAKGVVMIEFKVERDGNLEQTSLIIKKEMGSADLGRHAKAAIRDAAPFDHLPDAFSRSAVDIRLTFYYNTPMPSR